MRRWLQRLAAALALAAPAAWAQPAVQLESMRHAGLRLRHQHDELRFDAAVPVPGEVRFRLLPAWGGAPGVIVEAASAPGRYLRRDAQGGVQLASYDGTPAFRAAARWLKRDGLADATGVSLEAADRPGRFLQDQQRRPALAEARDAAAREASTFYLRPDTSAYVMGYFFETASGEGNSFGLHLAYSLDGLQWTPLNQSRAVITPALPDIHGLRDPFILRRQDGGFSIVATKGEPQGDEASIFAVDSPDLIRFDAPRKLVLHDAKPLHAWAPEAFWDARRGEYGILWSANLERRNRLMVSYTKDFKRISATETYFDPGRPVLDGHLQRFDGTTWLYYKDEADRYRIKGARSPDGQHFTTYTGPIQHGRIDMEAPTLIAPREQSCWLLIGDTYQPNGVLYTFENDDLTADRWRELDRRRYTPPHNAKHPTVVAVTAAELDTLIRHWGEPTWKRLKSHAAPFEWLAHDASQAVTRAEPFDPYKSSQWRVVVGLGDHIGLSFESLDQPDHYLRHVDGMLKLQRRDGSADFNVDATFYHLPGPADAAWSALRTQRDDKLFIQRRDGRIVIAPLTDEASRSAATWWLTP